MADPDLNIKDVTDALDSFYCHNVVAGLWADAVANRLEGLAIYLLSDELPEFTIPDCADPRAITSYALQRLDVIIAAYQAFLDKIRGRDDVSFALVVGLLAADTHRRADVAAALAGQETPA